MLRKTLTILSLVGLLLSVGTAGCGLLDLIKSECITDTDCDDGLYCNGAEACEGGECLGGSPPCPMLDEAPECGVYCNELFGACIAHSCTCDADCDDGDFCTGGEACVDCSCVFGEPPNCDDLDPCTDDTCDTDTGECVHAEVVCEDDDLFCNGTPYCSNLLGGCRHSEGNSACAFIGPCDEENDICIDAFGSKLCLEQCSLGLPTCVGQPLEDHDAFDEALAEMEAYFQGNCDGTWPAVFVGGCTEAGLTVIGATDGLHAVVDFYDADTGQFVAQRAWSDAIDPTCWGRTHWPIAVDCDGAVVTEVVCGTFWEVGETADVRNFWVRD